MYSVSTRCYYASGALLSEDLSHKIKGVRNGRRDRSTSHMEGPMIVTGASLGFAFVEYETEKEMRCAYEVRPIQNLSDPILTCSIVYDYNSYRVQELYKLSAEYEGKHEPKKLEELGSVLTSFDPGDSTK